MASCVNPDCVRTRMARSTASVSKATPSNQALLCAQVMIAPLVDVSSTSDVRPALRSWNLDTSGLGALCTAEQESSKR